LLLSIGLIVQVGHEVILRHRGLYAIFWHVRVGDPEEAVQHSLAKVIIAPVHVEVGARKAEPSAAVRPLDSPHHGFFSALRSLNMRVWTAGRDVRTISYCIRGFGDQNWRNSLHVRHEAHVEVPLIAHLEGLQAAGDWVLWKVLEVRLPHGVAG